MNPDTRQAFTAGEVARWLESEHGVRASKSAVVRLRAAAERHSSAHVREAIREEVAARIPAVLARVERAGRRLAEAAAKSKSTKDLAAALNAQTRALRELSTVCGLTAPQQIDVTSGGQPVTDVRVALSAQLARLAAGAEPGPAGGARRADERG